jgi:glycosyltransferase involved in cell wall biosynthesis
MRRSPYSNLHLHGQAPHALIPAYLAQFHFVLAPYQPQISIGSGADISRWISPMKLFEYMASGKSVICSDLPVLREIIEHGKNALLVPADNPSAWVDAITYLQKNPAIAQSLGAAAYGQILQNHTWDKRAAAIMAFIKTRLKN